MPSQNPEALIEGFQRKLRSQWEQHRQQQFNANTKGATYEKALRDFLAEYFNGVYSLRTRTAVVDRKLECFDIFNAGESELDVVASFRQAVPQIILQSGDMKWVPYDGVAFVCEVKSKLTTSALESDLEKLAKLNELGRDNISQRFTPDSAGQTNLFWKDEDGHKSGMNATVNHQLKCLVYDKSSISGETLIKKLQDFPDIWDLILIVEDDLLLVSPNLPFTDGWYDRISIEGIEDDSLDFPEMVVLPEGIIWFILLIAISIPRPRPFDAISALIQLVQREWRDEAAKYNTVVGAWNKLL